MAIDWVPCHIYEAVQTVPPVTQVNLPLMDPAVWSNVSEVTGVIEESSRYKILRIVGQFDIHWSGATGGAGAIRMRVWPGIQDHVLGVAQVPGLVTNALGANEKWWWERVFDGRAIQTWSWAMGDPYAHPYWTVLDIKPNMWMNQNDVPVVSIHNSDANETIGFQHRWRMLAAF